MSATDKGRLDDASTVTGLVKCNGTGNFSAAVAGTDYLISTNITTLVTALFTGAANQIFGTNGFQKLPGGLIIQWGQYTASTNGTFTVNLPFAFPVDLFICFGGTIALSSRLDSHSGSAGLNGASLSTILVTIDYVSPTTWIAIGR